VNHQFDIQSIILSDKMVLKNNLSSYRSIRIGLSISVITEKPFRLVP